MRVSVEATVCSSCGCTDLAVHQAGSLRITYCTSCGFERREQHPAPHTPWTKSERAEERAIKAKAISLADLARHRSSEPIRAIKRRFRERIDARNAFLKRALRR